MHQQTPDADIELSVLEEDWLLYVLLNDETLGQALSLDFTLEKVRLLFEELKVEVLVNAFQRQEFVLMPQYALQLCR